MGSIGNVFGRNMPMQSQLKDIHTYVYVSEHIHYIIVCVPKHKQAGNSIPG